MKKKLSTLIAFCFILGDLFFLNVAIVISYRMRGIVLVDREVTSGIYLLIFSNLMWLFLILITNPYRVTLVVQYGVILRTHFSFIFVHLLVVTSLVLFYNKNYEVPQLLLLYLTFIPAVLFWRLIFIYAIRMVINGPLGSINFIIVGQGALAQEIRRNYRFHPEYGYRFLGYFNEPWISGGETIALERIQKICLEKGVDEIYWCLPDNLNLELKRLIDFGLNYFIKVKRVTDYSTFYQRGIQLEREGQIPVVNVAAIALDDSINQFIKSVFDITFAVLVTVLVLSWMLPIIALIIKLDSRGPVIFKQLRAGKGNKPFLCMKFRTMVMDEKAEFVQATRNDPRITRLGKFLRKTSLDEFPQFLNVLVGEMSIVGPRPHPIKLNDEFSPKIRRLMSRHYVKPGITGLAQSLGYRGETINLSDMKNRITLDRFYVENWSLWFDIKIIFQTVISLFTSRTKAY